MELEKGTRKKWCTSCEGKKKGFIKNMGHFLHSLKAIKFLHKEEIDTKRVIQNAFAVALIYDEGHADKYIAAARKDFTLLYRENLLKFRDSLK